MFRSILFFLWVFFAGNGHAQKENDKDASYRLAYIDLPNNPKFAFGYGLSYTKFQYSNLVLSRKKMAAKETITASFTVTNTGSCAGEEVAQLYIGDMVASVVRPVKELKGFEKFALQPGESRTVSFDISEDLLSFYNNQLEKIAEAGEFKLMIGAASDDIRLDTMFELVK